jgi:methionine aminopeptidase
MIALPGLRNRKVVEPRSPGELDAMAAAGSLVAAALLAVRQAAAPGVSTLALDEIAESVIRDAGGTPSFLGYHGFPASICSSVNDRVVHGIRGTARIVVVPQEGVWVVTGTSLQSRDDMLSQLLVLMLAVKPTGIISERREENV